MTTLPNSITINPIPTQNVGAAFTIGGTINVNPVLTSLLDGTVDGSVSSPTLSMPWGPVNATAPGTVGTHTVNVTDAETGATASATFNVVIPTLSESPSGTVVTPASGGSIVLATGSQAVRNPAQAPGQDGRYYALPMQTTANIITSGAMITALRQGTPTVTQAGVPWVVAASADPDCSVSDGTKTITVKIPIGTTAGGGGVVGGAVYISPGGGSFTTGGHTYSLDANDNAIEDGVPMADGAGTSQMALYQGVVYGQDATSKNWFIWNGTSFNPAGSPPPAPGAGGSGISSLGGTDSTRPYVGWTANGVLIDGSATNPIKSINGSPLTDGVALTQAQVNTIAAAIDTQQSAEVPGGETFGHAPYPQNFLIGDTIIATAAGVQKTGNVGSLTDLNGNVWTLVAGTTADSNPPAWWWGGIALNGVLQWGGYNIAIRKLNDGTVWVEEAKQGGWWSLTAFHAGATKVYVADPGPGPNNVGGASMVTCSGMQVFDCTGPVAEDATVGMTTAGARDNAIGNLQEFELLAAIANPSYVPPHVVMCSLDLTQLSSSAAAAWPATIRDTGGTGPIPEGVTLCIPHTTAKPNGQSRGFNLLFDIGQQKGFQVRGSNATGAVSIAATPLSSATQALCTDMNASIHAVMGLMGILAFDGSSGSQTGPTTAKGMVNGVRADAFAAPAPIDLSPTGGTPATPNTFGAWYATGQGIFYNIASAPTGGAVPTTTESATITTAAKIAFNGTPDNTTANVVELLYWNHVLYQKNAAGNWFSGHDGSYAAVSVSASGTAVTDGTGIILDSAGDIVTLAGGKVVFTGVADNTTANVTTVLWFNGLLYQENSAGSWWVGTKGNWGNQLAGGDPRNVVTPPPGANFSILKNQSIIIAPNGQRWFGKGVDVAPWGRPVYQAVTNGTKPLTDSLPGITFFQIYLFNDEGYNVDTGLFPIIDALTAAGIVVCLHSCNSNFVNSVPTGGNLTAECNAFAGYATHYLSNPYVWFCTDNEPHDENVGFGAVTAEHLAVYNAIRGTGNNNMIGLSVPNPGNDMNASNYAQMFNVYWEQHYYPFEDGIGGFAYITSFQPLNTLPSRDGLMPMIIGEFGSSTSGNNSSGIDGPGLPSHLMSQPRYTNLGSSMILNGWAEWGIATSGEFDQIFGQNNASGTLNSYGQELAGFIVSA